MAATLCEVAALAMACTDGPAGSASVFGATAGDGIAAAADVATDTEGGDEGAILADTRADSRTDGSAVGRASDSLIAKDGAAKDSTTVTEPKCDPQTGEPPAKPSNCLKGKAVCEVIGSKSALSTCNSVGCWNTGICPTEGPCVEAGPAGTGCTSGFGSCEGIYAAFDYLVKAHSACTASSQCTLLKARCSVGLGVWGVGTNGGFTQAQLEGLAKTALKLGCTNNTCVDTAPATKAICLNGFCQAGL
ncbi:MAG: hypothetical protein EXR77_06760 [Myxococcales bacterium]|nr:hypothetical protein [Myxococcales bacterium]